MNIPDPLAIIISIFLMAITIIASARLVLRVSPPPYSQAILIAAVSNLLGKLFVSVLHWPGLISYSLPTVAFLILSYIFFKPRMPMLLLKELYRRLSNLRKVDCPNPFVFWRNYFRRPYSSKSSNCRLTQSTRARLPPRPPERWWSICQGSRAKSSRSSPRAALGMFTWMAE